MGAATPENGGRPGPYAALELRVDAHDIRLDEHDGKFGAVLREVGEMVSAAKLTAEKADLTYDAAKKAADEVQGVRSDLRDEREARLRECSIRHCDTAPRGPLPSIDYDGLSDTGVVRVTEMLREENTLLHARTAALEARLEERDRQSERARALVEKAEQRDDALAERRWTKTQKLGAGVLALLAAAGGGAGVVEIAKALLGH